MEAWELLERAIGQIVLGEAANVRAPGGREGRLALERAVSADGGDEAEACMLNSVRRLRLPRGPSGWPVVAC